MHAPAFMHARLLLFAAVLLFASMAAICGAAWARVAAVLTMG
ncbi:hypothetical protein [Micropruina sp.]